MGIAKLNAPDMNQKEVIKFVRENIKSLDTVNSTGTHLVVRPEDKPKPIDEDLIEGGKRNWGPWQPNSLFISNRG